jgi:acetylornithine deacetylase
MLHAHMDTVPVSDAEAAAWSSPPFVAVEVNGRIYGKGSVDDKGPLAAMMIALKKLAKSDFQGTLVLVAAAEEEVGGQLGSKWLVDGGYLPRCDFILVGEQTHNRVAIAHKGVMRAAIRTLGHSVHATNPDRGVNAINAMARVILALERYHQGLAQRSHPLVGAPTCNVGLISGGTTANAVADQCVIHLDRRMIPGEKPEEVQAELQSVLDLVEVAPATVELGEFLYSSPFESSLKTHLGEEFLRCVVQVTSSPAEPVGYLPGSDAKHLVPLSRGDIVIFGPGSYEVAHSFDEYVEIEELKQCEKIISAFLERVMRSEVKR